MKLTLETEHVGSEDDTRDWAGDWRGQLRLGQEEMETIVETW